MGGKAEFSAEFIFILFSCQVSFPQPDAAEEEEKEKEEKLEEKQTTQVVLLDTEKKSQRK